MSRFSSPYIHASPEKGLHDPGSHPDINSLPEALEFPSNAGGPHSLRQPEYFHQRDLRFRKPSLTYYNSGLRDSPDDRTAQKCHKAFVTIIPPPLLLQETNHLGHILSTGPTHRASQGLIMPLFPTIYGQLTAIAREFNFPSTAGLCLYLQLSENGIQSAPRISDDCWQMFWSHLFEGSNIHQTRGLQMGGRVEFDIDLRQARWFTSWVTSLRRGAVNMSTSFSSVHNPVTRTSGDSKTIVPEDFTVEGDFSTPSVQQRSMPLISRHTPKKLSLVDKTNPHLRTDFVMNYDHLHLPIKTSHHSPPENTRTQPKLAHDVDSRVKSWRDSASQESSKISGQPLITDNCPSESFQDASAQDQEIDFNDYSWSVTSAGLRDDVRTPASSPPRVLTPDIAQRMYDETPLTPLTATTWGPPSSYPPSPGIVYYHAPSVDLGQRNVFSRPLTPATATSWGPSDWTSSSPLDIYSYRCRSIDLGQRNIFSRPLTPATETSWGPNDSTPPVSPFSDLSFPSIHLADRGDFSRPLTPLSQDNTEPNSDLSWRQDPESELIHNSIATATLPYPVLKIYNAIYPWNLEDIYPVIDGDLTGFTAKPTNENESKKDENRSTLASVHVTSYPPLCIYPAVYPYFFVYPDVVYAEPAILYVEDKHDSHSLGRGFPYFDLYPPVYPHFDLYPDLVVRRTSMHDQYYSHNMLSKYPNFDLYPPVYPHFDVYPVAIEHQKSHEAVRGYPNFDLYPAIYPHFDLYPAVAIRHTKIRAQHYSDRADFGYPNFDLFPAVYPHFVLYPAVAVIHDQHYMNSQVSEYPYFDLYPAVYPHFTLYPAVAIGHSKVYQGDESNTTFTSRISQSHPRLSSYPVFDLYPPVYPYFDLFPPLVGLENTSVALRGGSFQPVDKYYGQIENFTEASSLVRYPMFNIYPPIYPDLEIYSQTQLNSSFLIPNSSGSYPTFNLYPVIYPYFNLYPSIAGRMDLTEPQPSIESFSISHTRHQVDLAVAKLDTSRLTHSELHAMVMMENNMSTIIGTQRSRQKPFSKNYRQLSISHPRTQSTLPRASPLTSSRQLPAPPLSVSQPSSAFDLMSSYTNEVLSNSKRRSFIHRPSSAFRNGFRGSANSSDTSDVSP